MGKLVARVGANFQLGSKRLLKRKKLIFTSIEVKINSNERSSLCLPQAPQHVIRGVIEGILPHSTNSLEKCIWKEMSEYPKILH